MIAKIIAMFALVGAAVAAPVSRSFTTGLLPSGVAFGAQGPNSAGAAADEESGIAGAGTDVVGTVIGVAGPGLAVGAAVASPTL